jgi:hypothetical protein
MKKVLIFMRHRAKHGLFITHDLWVDVKSNCPIYTIAEWESRNPELIATGYLNANNEIVAI